MADPDWHVAAQKPDYPLPMDTSALAWLAMPSSADVLRLCAGGD